MEFIYVFKKGNDWEDLIIYLSKEKALEVSLKYPTFNIEIFSLNNTGGYVPTYNYYLNGIKYITN
jgi:hypothetical protein